MKKGINDLRDQIDLISEKENQQVREMEKKVAELKSKLKSEEFQNDTSNTQFERLEREFEVKL